MAQARLTPQLHRTEEEAITILFRLTDDAYAHLNSKGRRYESLKWPSDSEVLTLAIFQQLRDVQSERSFLRDVGRFFSHLFPGAVGLLASSLHRRLRKLRCFLEPLRRSIPPELVGDPETLLVDSTLLSVLQPTPGQAVGGLRRGRAWVRWSPFLVYGAKPRLLCATNGVPVSYELTPANVAEVRLTEEPLVRASLGEEVGRRLLGDPVYRSEESEEALAEVGVLLVSERAGQRGQRQGIESCFSSLKRVFGLGETLARKLVGAATRIVAKMSAHTYGFLVNRRMSLPQGRIKELWA